jgi:hypothetical protein
VSNQERQQNPGASREVDEEGPGPEESAINDFNSPSGLPETSTPEPSTSARSKPKSPTTTHRSKSDGELKRLIDLDRGDWAEREEKRLKMQADVQIQIARIQAESQERFLEMQMQMQRDEREYQREREKERDERQLQMIQSVMASVIGIVNSATRPNHTNGDSS